LFILSQAAVIHPISTFDVLGIQVIGPERENAIQEILEPPKGVLKFLSCPGIVYEMFTISCGAF
jgi:hypothetical protein